MTDAALHPAWPRAAANAIWKPLRHAHLDGWPIAPTDWTVNDPRGNPQSGRHSTTPPTPGPTPQLEPLEEIERVIGELRAADWPGGVTLAARLTREAHDACLETVGVQTRYEYGRALRNSTARAPFVQDTNRHGTPILRRNPDVNALITPMVAALLETLAHAAYVEVITSDLEAALITERDRIRATEVFAIAEKAGVTL